MRDPTPVPIHLKDYAPPAFLIETVELDVELFEDHARVRSRLACSRNPRSADSNAPLVLDAEELQFEWAKLDERPLAAGEYALGDAHFAVAKVPARFVLETACRITPRTNTTLTGLYAAENGFFTQCEAEGFRRITYFIDRPDVMAKYSVTIHADREKYPVLLSNGNLVARGDEAGARQWVKWQDPFPKPCYLFAMVAAKLDKLEDQFVTRSGRRVRLAIYVDPGKLDQCGFAMQALKKSMKWDEDEFGLEVDLDNYTIVAVGDFNMGAMENKGLNVFNTKYVLARPDTATDGDYLGIDRVIAHEYFHNWTGNRVTCRDWFQLSLKEGLTVFRDQEFGADIYSRAVERIREVRDLRGGQFAEDAGPMAHPVRPASYMEINNFYTSTVYEKGAEVVRMIRTLIGSRNFRKGMDLYFARHDGQAVTCDDFVRAMADAAGADLSQFMRWYDQAGTPVLEVAGEYDADAKRYVLSVKQSCPPTPGQETKLPFHIPFAVGLVGPDGRDLLAEGTRVLSVKRPEERFVFENIVARPVLSPLRNFSAPVIVAHDYTEAELTHLMAHDSDAFNRWEAGQRLALGIMLRGIAAVQGARALEVPRNFADAAARVLDDSSKDPAFAAEMLALPSESYIAEQVKVVDPGAIHTVRDELRRRLAAALGEELHAVYRAHGGAGPYSPDAVSAGRRALKNSALGLLMELDDAGTRALCMKQFETADNMTDALAALCLLADCDCPERARALAAFYDKWKTEPLVVDKWLAVQATTRLRSALADVKRLMAHPAFSIRNPNKVYALIGGFRGNQVHFHAADGSGYAFLTEQVIALDAINPQVAARMARGFDRWKKFDAGRQAHARAALERLRDAKGISKGVLEIVTRALA
ncbi:MAG: aminopeptidase N [Betaproteobacteria bacterium]|nr:MAG: aminopeptidase N [Betaproteobacteria bacterium]